MIISDYPRAIGLLSMLLSAFLLACSDDAVTGSRPAKKDHLVEVHKATIEPVQTGLTASGSLKAKRNVRIYNEVSARVIELPLYPGDLVSAGDLLVKLDDRLISAELDKAVAMRRQAETDVARLRKLGPRQLASADEIARAETELEVAAAEEKLQRTRLAQTEIRAPFDGVVTQRLVEPGDVVSMHSHLMSLIDPDSLMLVIRLSERWMPYVSVDDPVSVTIGALGGSAHDARISRIYPDIDTATRKGTVEVSFEPQPFGVQAGQLATARLSTQPVERLVIPAHALHHDSTGAYVYTLDTEDKANKQHVTKGEQFGDRLAILSGLDIDSRVVSKGFIGLRNGKAVRVIGETTTVSTTPDS